MLLREELGFALRPVAILEEERGQEPLPELRPFLPAKRVQELRRANHGTGAASLASAEGPGLAKGLKLWLDGRHIPQPRPQALYEVPARS